jgi:hypothetical protein
VTTRQQAEYQAFHRGGNAGSQSAGDEFWEPSTQLTPLFALLGERSVSSLTNEMDTPGVVSAMAGATDATGTRTGGEICSVILALAADFASRGGDVRVNTAASPPIVVAAAFFFAAAMLAGWVEPTATLRLPC